MRAFGDKSLLVKEEHGLNRSDSLAAGKFYRQSIEPELRSLAAQKERQLQLEKGGNSLAAVEDARFLLADCLYSKGKTQEADGLLLKCIRDEVKTKGHLEENSVSNLYSKWRQSGLDNRRAMRGWQDVSNLSFLKSDIETHGQKADFWLAERMKKSQVLAVGEEHTYLRKNDSREFLTKHMSDLKNAGATHLAIEFPSEHQKMLDHFVESNVWDVSFRPSDEMNLDLRSVADFQANGDRQRMILAAHDAGLIVVAVDSGELLNKGLGSVKFTGLRDKYMAQRIGNILDEKTGNKVVFYAGAHHTMTNPHKDWHDSAAELLKEKNVKVTSVYNQISQSQYLTAPLYAATKLVSDPVSVSCHKAKNIARLPEDLDFYPGQQQLSAWDAVIIYPQK